MDFFILLNHSFNALLQRICKKFFLIIQLIDDQSCRKDGFLSFKTNCYKLNYYETPTGLKFILNTDNNVGNIRDILHQLYSTVSDEFHGRFPIVSMFRYSSIIL